VIVKAESERRKLLADKDLEELQERLDALEERQKTKATV
jgi:tetrahydromethanopterin S-methyltransferase subunit G